jgi:hypothetical protein
MSDGLEISSRMMGDGNTTGKLQKYSNLWLMIFKYVAHLECKLFLK